MAEKEPPKVPPKGCRLRRWKPSEKVSEKARWPGELSGRERGRIP
jgi:hypothetical protein